MNFYYLLWLHGFVLVAIMLHVVFLLGAFLCLCRVLHCFNGISLITNELNCVFFVCAECLTAKITFTTVALFYSNLLLGIMFFRFSI